MNRAGTHGYAWLPAMAFAVFASCIGLNSRPYAPEIPLEARSALEAALEAFDEGRSREGIDRLEQLVDDHPHYVAAHRQLQNAYLAENRYGYLRNRYRALLEADDEQPAHHYLYSRLFADPGQQINGFKRAVDLDPSFFWGYHGLGYAYRNNGDLEKSAIAFEEAIRSDPGRVEPYIGLAGVLLALKRNDAARQLIADGLERFPEDLSLRLIDYRQQADATRPADALMAMTEVDASVELRPDFFAQMLQWIDQEISASLVRKIVYRFGPGFSAEVLHGGVLDMVLGICCRRIGDSASALRHFERALAAAPASARARREVRSLYARSFRFREACALYTEGYPAEWITESPLDDLFAELYAWEDRLRDRAPAVIEATALLEVGELLTRLGWLEAAAYHLRGVAGSAAPGSAVAAGAHEALNAIYAHLRFEAALKKYFLDQYQRFNSGGADAGFDEMLDELAGISEDCLGENLFEDLVFIDFSPVGKVLDPRASVGNKPCDYFRRFNRFFILGQKLGGPVEAYLMDRVDERPDLSYHIADSEVLFDLIRCENLRIPSYIEFQGGQIVGAALMHFIFFNMDAIRSDALQTRALHEHWQPQESLLLDDPAPRADTIDERLCIEESLGLPSRLRYLSFQRQSGEHPAAPYLKSRFDTIFQHELQHLVDARRFLPLSEHLFETLYRFTIMGFSPFQVEAWLEYRAQLFALLTGPDPLGVLAEIAEFLDPMVYRAPHAVGYARLMERILEKIDAHPEDYPRFDRSANLLHQLHRLTPDQAREIAGTLAAEDGLLETENRSDGGEDGTTRQTAP